MRGTNCPPLSASGKCRAEPMSPRGVVAAELVTLVPAARDQRLRNRRAAALR